MGKLLRSTLFWIGFMLFGWYFPRSLVHRETSILSLQPPYQLSGETVIVDFELNQPLVDPPTIDDLLLRCMSVWFPFVFFALHAWYSNPAYFKTESIASNPKQNSTTLQKLYLVATVISAFSMAIGLSEGCTVMIKLWVKRRRPNFYELCGFNPATRNCEADTKHIREANFSFPSGHSSLTCCGMTFLVWYLHGARGATTVQHTESSRLFDTMIRTCLPWGWALFVAASRLVDHWHHPSDVLAGLGLGFVTCTIAYHHWYPPVWSPYAGIPRALLLLTNIPHTTVISTTITSSKRRQLKSQTPQDMA